MQKRRQTIKHRLENNKMQNNSYKHTQTSSYYNTTDITGVPQTVNSEDRAFFFVLGS